MFRTLLLLCCAGFLTAGGAAHAQDVPALVPQKVSAHGWFFQGEAGMASAANRGFMSNAGFVVTSAGVVVFDALGTPALGLAMKKAIAAITPQPIRRIVVSHYHADHIYGLQALAGPGVEIWAHREARRYLDSALAADRLAQRRAELAPWVDEHTRVVPPTLFLDGDTDFRLGDVSFRLIYAGPAHAPEDLMMYVVEDRALFAGDLFATGRVPYVGNADSRGWLAGLEKLIPLAPAVAVPGHGAPSNDVATDLIQTRDYLQALRREMRRAVVDLVPFDEAYEKADWSRFEMLPAFAAANRINAYGTYLLIEQEELDAAGRQRSSLGQ
jgi:glyoxylase-like metal-dependent hydrolase (beta-lactamase superfamily II)